MKEQKKVLLITGSPKAQSTSASLGAYLLSGMWDKGSEVAVVQVNKILKSDEALEETLDAVNKSDVLVMAFPLYVDAVPFPMVKLMEAIAERRKDVPNLRRPRMLAIVNCGFPEAYHNDTALAICRRFAKEAGIDW
ncbi:MAG: NAD(P)H-dependent oxidoreductase, partial [Deltaproteobacteria bacterium]|nr:NAD(P)H-dependent oxidoreductase [Deltaproteobacteria bacterium]